MTDADTSTASSLSHKIDDKCHELKMWRISRQGWVDAQNTGRNYQNDALIDEAEREIAACDQRISRVREELSALRRAEATGAVL